MSTTAVTSCSLGKEWRGGPVKQPDRILWGKRCILETSDSVEVLSVWFWRTHRCNNEIFFFQMNDFSWETCLYFHFFLLQMCSKWEGLCWVSCSFFALIQILLEPSYPAANGLFPLKNIPKHKALSAQTAEKKKMKACLTFQEYLVLLPKSHSAPGNAIPVSALSITSSPVVPSAASALPILPPAWLAFAPQTSSSGIIYFQRWSKAPWKGWEDWMDFGARDDSSKRCGKQFAGQRLFFGSTRPCRHCSHPLQTLEGTVPAGRRDNRIRLNGLFGMNWFCCTSWMPGEGGKGTLQHLVPAEANLKYSHVL